jgi:hypothetical protein
MFIHKRSFCPWALMGKPVAHRPLDLGHSATEFGRALLTHPLGMLRAAVTKPKRSKVARPWTPIILRT